MTEPKYPRVFGFWSERSGRFTDDMRKTRSEAESESNSDETVIELIPLPEHESIVAAARLDEVKRAKELITQALIERQSVVAAAVAAAVERCAGIAQQVAAESGGPVGETQADWLGDPSSPPYCCGAADAADEIERRIREVPK